MKYSSRVYFSHKNGSFVYLVFPPFPSHTFLALKCRKKRLGDISSFSFRLPFIVSFHSETAEREIESEREKMVEKGTHQKSK